MTRLGVLAVAAVVVAALTGGGLPAGSATFGPRLASATPEVSSNWSGYAAVAPSGGPVVFRDVTGTWVQPRATCTAGRSDGVAFWVGLGGYSESSQALEQLGTAAECDGSGRAARHYVWWEIVPAAVVQVPMKLYPGDTVTAAVVVEGQKVTMSLKNVTRRARFSKTFTVAQPLDVTSAEWIAEAPASCGSRGHCRVIPLTNFGSVAFTKAAAIGNDHPGTISDPTWSAVPIQLVTSSSGGRFFDRGDVLGPGVGAVPGELSADGRSFTVSWAQNLTPPGR